MTDATLLPFDLSAVRRKKLTVDFGGGNQSSNGGLLLLRRAERNIGICRRLADAMPDRRDASRIRHAMFEMVMARVCAIACGHEDAIDLDRLRHDPLMKVAVGRCPQSGAPLASQSTISRLENAPSKTEAARLTAALVDQAGATIEDVRRYQLHLAASSAGVSTLNQSVSTLRFLFKVTLGGRYRKSHPVCSRTRSWGSFAALMRYLHSPPSEGSFRTIV